MWWLLQVLGQRDPITLSGFEYPREEPVPLWSAWTVNSLRFGDCSFKSSSCISHKTSCMWNSLPQMQFCFCQRSSCVPAKPRNSQTAQCRLCSLHLWCLRTCWVGSFSFQRLGHTPGQDRDRNHFCLPGMETSPATFLSPRVAFRKWLSCFGLHKSSLEAFSCGDVTLQHCQDFQ